VTTVFPWFALVLAAHPFSWIIMTMVEVQVVWLVNLRHRSIDCIIETSLNVTKVATVKKRCFDGGKKVFPQCFNGGKKGVLTGFQW